MNSSITYEEQKKEYLDYLIKVATEVDSQSSMRRILDYYGVSVNRNGQCVCPFHNDTKPSMSIERNDKYVHCFVDDKTWYAVNFIKDYESSVNGNELRYYDRIKKAIDIQGLNIELLTFKEYFKINNTKPRRLTPDEKERNAQFEILKDAKNVAVACLNADKEKHGVVSRYLASRGISDKTINYFEIGYNENSAIQDNLSDKYDTEDLYKVGVLGKSSVNDKYYDFQYDRILIPITDENGNIVGFGGRSRENNPTIKYKNTRQTKLFNKSNILFNYNNAKYEATKRNEIIIVEGYFDTISAYEMGIKNCVALMSVALTEEHKKMLQQIGSNNLTVTLCLDNDDAGRKAMCKIIPELLATGFDVNVIDTAMLNKGKDMNDFLCNGVTIDDLEAVKLSALEFLFKYTFETIEKQKGKVDITTIGKVYNIFFKEEQFNNTFNEELFIEYVSNNYGYSKETINNVIHPQKNSTLISLAMQQFFCVTIKNNLVKIADKSENRVLQQFLSQGRLTLNHIMNGLNSSEYIKNNGTSIDVVRYCEEYLMKTQEYKEFEAKFDIDFDRILNNAYGMDKSGNMMQIRLTAHQKDIIQNQYLSTFDNDIMEFFKEENDRFEKIFIADNITEYERMIGNEYYFRDEALEQYKSGKMCFINYGAMFDQNDLDKLSRTNPNEYTTKNGDKFQTVFVFNNSSKELELKPEQFIVNDYEQDMSGLNVDILRHMPNEYSKQTQMKQPRRNQRVVERTHNSLPTQPAD